MAALQSSPSESTSCPLTLGRLNFAVNHKFSTPKKCINDGNDLDFFFSSTAYRDLSLWLLQLNRSMFPSKDDLGKVTLFTLTQPPVASSTIQRVRRILDSLSELIGEAPPSTAPRRFGNVAFRDWSSLASSRTTSLLTTYLSELLQRYSSDQRTALVDELREYLIGSFGSAQRLDYGTGHELSFMAFLGGLWKLGAFECDEERAIVICLVQPYLELVRALIMTYTLEPAGSHGVWGLDDHSFVPYIFGAAQFGPAINVKTPTAPVPTEGSLPSAPPPGSVTKKDVVADYKDNNMYFSAIQFIYDVKRGPFWEHSPVLYDVSGIKDGWGKINKGMLKMYAAEVLGKFPVVQHFPFGSLFEWQRDPNTTIRASSVHAQQQPPVSKDVMRSPGTSVGTAAPWATSSPAGSVLPGMQSSTGVPTARSSRSTTRAYPDATTGQRHLAGPITTPWTSTVRSSGATDHTGASPPLRAPWASKQAVPPSGSSLAPTSARWTHPGSNT